MTKLAVAIVAAAVGSAEAFGWHPAFHSRKPTSTDAEKAKAHLDTKTLATHGYDAHTLANVQKHGGLGMCQGDCDSDSHCRSGLKCYHSSWHGNTVTGCEGKTHRSHDYCYSPLKLSDPKRCQEWSCAEWCQFFDQAAEDAGVYKANGCGDDGMDTCACN
jgi:hypothetical protein